MSSAGEQANGAALRPRSRIATADKSREPPTSFAAVRRAQAGILSSATASTARPSRDVSPARKTGPATAPRSRPTGATWLSRSGRYQPRRGRRQQQSANMFVHRPPRPPHRAGPACANGAGPRLRGAGTEARTRWSTSQQVATSPSSRTPPTSSAATCDNANDAFVHDLDDGTTERASVATGGRRSSSIFSVSVSSRWALGPPFGRPHPTWSRKASAAAYCGTAVFRCATGRPARPSRCNLSSPGGRPTGTAR